MPTLGTLGFIFVHKSGVHEEDFIVKRGGDNQSKASHKKLYDDRDAIYVENNYPELSNAGKRMCQKELLRRLFDTDGRMLKPVDDNVDWYYVVPENEELKIISAKFRPSLKRKPILTKRIRQRTAQQVCHPVQLLSEGTEQISQRTAQQVCLPAQLLLSDEPSITTVDEADDTVTGQYDDNEEDTVVEGGLECENAFIEVGQATYMNQGESSETSPPQHCASPTFGETLNGHQGKGMEIDEEWFAGLF